MRPLFALVVLVAGGTAAAQTVAPSQARIPAPGIGAQNVATQQNSAAATQQNPSAVGQSTTLPSVTIPPSATGVPPTNAPTFPGLGVPAGATPQSLETRGAVALDAAQIATLQTQLQAFGFYRGPIDGTLNGTTRSGLRAFQEAARIPPTGIPDAATVGALGIVAVQPGAGNSTSTTPSTTTPTTTGSTATTTTSNGASAPATAAPPTPLRNLTPFPLSNGPTSAGEDQQFFIQP